MREQRRVRRRALRPRRRPAARSLASSETRPRGGRLCVDVGAALVGAALPLSLAARRPRRTRRRRASSAASSCCAGSSRGCSASSRRSRRRAPSAPARPSAAPRSPSSSAARSSPRRHEWRRGHSHLGVGSRCTGLELLELVVAEAPPPPPPAAACAPAAGTGGGEVRLLDLPINRSSAVCRPPHADAGVGGDAPVRCSPHPRRHLAVHRPAADARAGAAALPAAREPAAPRGGSAGAARRPTTVRRRCRWRCSSWLRRSTCPTMPSTSRASRRAAHLAPSETLISRLPSHLILPLAGTIDAVPPAADGGGGGGRSRLHG